MPQLQTRRKREIETKVAALINMKRLLCPTKVGCEIPPFAAFFVRPSPPLSLLSPSPNDSPPFLVCRSFIWIHAVSLFGVTRSSRTKGLHATLSIPLSAFLPPDQNTFPPSQEWKGRIDRPWLQRRQTSRKMAPPFHRNDHSRIPPPLQFRTARPSNLSGNYAGRRLSSPFFSPPADVQERKREGERERARERKAFLRHARSFSFPPSLSPSFYLFSRGPATKKCISSSVRPSVPAHSLSHSLQQSARPS